MRKEDLSGDVRLLLIALQSLLAGCGFALEDAIKEAKSESDLLLSCGFIMETLTAKAKKAIDEGIPDCLLMMKE